MPNINFVFYGTITLSDVPSVTARAKLCPSEDNICMKDGALCIDW